MAAKTTKAKQLSAIRAQAASVRDELFSTVGSCYDGDMGLDSNMDRREFLRGTASSATALSFLSVIPGKAGAEPAQPDFNPDTPEGEIETALLSAGEKIKGPYQKLVQDFTEILKDPEQRKELLENMGGKLTTLSVNAPHIYPVWRMMYSMLKAEMNDPGIPYEDIKPSAERESLSPRNELRLTNSIHHRTEDFAEYRNLGVIHAGGPRWEKQKDLIFSAIQDADIVLLEPGDPGWFPLLGRYAEDHGKQTRYLEGSAGGVVALCANAFALWCVYDMLQMNPLKQAERGAWTKELTKAWIAQQLGIWPLSSQIESTIRGKNLKDAYRGRFSFDYLKDARTIWMLLDIQKIRQDPNNLERKILSITGDGHAKGFELYISNPTELLIKRVLYDTVFCLHHAADYATKP